MAVLNVENITRVLVSEQFKCIPHSFQPVEQPAQQMRGKLNGCLPQAGNGSVQRTGALQSELKCNTRFFLLMIRTRKACHKHRLLFSQPF